MTIDYNARAYRLLEARYTTWPAVTPDSRTEREGVGEDRYSQHLPGFHFAVEVPQRARSDPNRRNDRDRHRRDVPDYPDRHPAGRVAQGRRLGKVALFVCRRCQVAELLDVTRPELSPRYRAYRTRPYEALLDEDLCRKS